MHIGRGLWYGSYRSPRVLVWSIGVIILVLMIAIGFLGYVLPFSQMSFWGIQSNCPTCGFLYFLFLSFYDFIMVYLSETKTAIRVRGECRIGPHNKDIISILYGSLLGDAHAEKRAKGKGTRISFYQEDSHSEYLL